MDEYVNTKWVSLNRSRMSALTCEDCPLSGVPNSVSGVLALHLKEHPSHRVILTDVETTITRFEGDPDADQAAAVDVPAQGRGQG